MSHQAPQSTQIRAFVVGRTYSTRSICDHDCIIRVTVESRTAKTIKATVRGELKTFRVSEYRGVEQVKYSMAPIIGADDTKELVPAPERISVLKRPTMSQGAMAEACPPDLARDFNAGSVRLPDGSQWLFDQRYGHWACTRAAA